MAAYPLHAPFVQPGYRVDFAAPMPLDAHDSLDRIIEAAAENPARRVLVELAVQTQTGLTRWVCEAGPFAASHDLGLPSAAHRGS